MVAQNLIKALNSRLTQTPSIGAKVGYGALIVGAGIVAAAIVLVVLIGKAAVSISLVAINALWDTKFDVLSSQASDDEPYVEHGLENGPEGLGYYSHGVRIDND